MLRVECESCKAPYQVDERRIPATGLKMRCPKCGHTFVVKAGSGEPVPPPDPHARSTPGNQAPAPAPAQRKMQATMLGVGSGISKPPPSAIARKEPVAEAATPSESEVGLPAAKPAAPVPPKAPFIARPTPQAFRGTIVSAVPAPQRTVTDGDLPAVRDEAGLPVARAKGVAPPVPMPRAAAPAAAPKPAPPTKAADPFLDLDLPTKTQGNVVPPSDVGLPAAANPNGTRGRWEASRPEAAPPVAPPALPIEIEKSPMDGFGEIDLPAIGAASNLPAIAANNLPAVATNNLPAVTANLPAVADALPMTADELPSPANVLPVAANVLPARRDVDPISPEPISVPPPDISMAPELADFGELDLPPPPAQPASSRGAAPAPAMGRGDPAPFSFSDAPGLDMSDPPPLQTMSFPPSPSAPTPHAPPRPAAAGNDDDDDDGLSFGEVRLAGDDDSQSIEAEASLDVVPGPRPDARSAVEEAIPSAPRKQRAAESTGSKAGRKIALGVFAVTLLGGAALEISPFGAFGRLAIVDAISAGDYDKRAVEASAAARRKMGSDLFPDARAASDQVAAARAEMPRARALTAYAALVEYETQLRFGPASERLPRVRQWLVELAAHGGETKYLPVALAAQEALSGDPKKARAALDAASKRDVGDPLQEDIAMVRGELELAQKDPQAALAAFTKAGTLSKTARSEFGRARALVLARDANGAKKALEETLKLAPKHVGALIERAALAWDAKDEAAAIADLAAVLEGPAKDAASDTAKAQAHALRGWIHVGRGRAADARTSFDAALKLDGRNVSALVGQGEVLFSEGRLTEALTRFDTAVQTDPANIPAVISDAKAKIALERLQDAKTQLAAARAKVPRDWRVAYWLGKAELALGNKPAADKELMASLELLDLKDADAYQPYVALATLYGALGRTKDAEAKLAEAKAKLPDSSSLRRALGEVAASRGDFEVAVQHFRTAIEKDPLDLSTRFRLGVTLRRMRKVAEASAEFDKIVAVDKDYPGLALERGLLYEESGDIDKALEQFQSALARAPDDADLKLRVGAAFVAIGRPGDALPMLRAVFAIRGQSAEANHFLGRALFLQSGGASQVEAMRFLKRAAELDPNRAEYHLYVGWAANNAIPAQLGLARDSIEKALTIDKLLADAYWQRGVLGRKQGAVDDAIADLKRALELKPTRIDAHASLAECYSDKNDTNAALSEWQKALASDTIKPDWHFKYGKLLFLRGNVGDATKHLVLAADEGEKMDPKPGWLHEAEFLAGEVLRKSGKRAEAIERYKRFLEIAPTNSPDRKDATTALSDLGAKPRPR